MRTKDGLTRPGEALIGAHPSQGESRFALANPLVTLWKSPIC
jgi:hypothetical protein